MACRRMTSQVFALFTSSLESWSSQAASIAETLTPEDPEESSVMYLSL